jgi:hypothetical protein
VIRPSVLPFGGIGDAAQLEFAGAEQGDRDSRCRASVMRASTGDQDHEQVCGGTYSHEVARGRPSVGTVSPLKSHLSSAPAPRSMWSRKKLGRAPSKNWSQSTQRCQPKGPLCRCPKRYAPVAKYRCVYSNDRIVLVEPSTRNVIRDCAPLRRAVRSSRLCHQRSKILGAASIVP